MIHTSVCGSLHAKPSAVLQMPEVRAASEAPHGRPEVPVEPPSDPMTVASSRLVSAAGGEEATGAIRAPPVRTGDGDDWTTVKRRHAAGRRSPPPAHSQATALPGMEKVSQRRH